MGRRPERPGGQTKSHSFMWQTQDLHLGQQKQSFAFHHDALLGTGVFMVFWAPEGKRGATTIKKTSLSGSLLSSLTLPKPLSLSDSPWPSKAATQLSGYTGDTLTELTRVCPQFSLIAFSGHSTSVPADAPGSGQGSQASALCPQSQGKHGIPGVQESMHSNH